MTCNHVIESADDILVKTSDNREYKARVVGTDVKTDIAVLKLKRRIFLQQLSEIRKSSVLGKLCWQWEIRMV